MKKLTAGDVMNTKILSVRDDLTLHELATFLTENEISGAPVLDSTGKLVGVISLTDIALSEAERASLEAEPAGSRPYSRAWNSRFDRGDMSGMHLEDRGLLVRDVMTPAAYTIPATLPLRQAAETMIAGRLHRLLVTDNHRVAGIVTPLDILSALLREDLL
jgi:CBS domain-containing protein